MEGLKLRELTIVEVAEVSGGETTSSGNFYYGGLGDAVNNEFDDATCEALGNCIVYQYSF